MLFIQEIKDVINLNEFKPIGTLWIAQFVNGNNVSYFDSFRVEQLPEGITNYI